jgi:hypothetical protein
MSQSTNVVHRAWISGQDFNSERGYVTDISPSSFIEINFCSHLTIPVYGGPSTAVGVANIYRRDDIEIYALGNVPRKAGR